MPPVVLAAAAGAASAAFAGATAAVIIGNAVVAGGLALVGQVLAPSPPKAAVTDLSTSRGSNPVAAVRDRKFLVRSAVYPRRVIYGRAKVAGALVHAATAGDSNEKLHMVIALAGHQIDAVEATWLGDELVGPLDTSGNVTTGRFAGSARIRFGMGTTTQDADLVALEELPGWTVDHRLLGIAYAWVTLTTSRESTVWPTGIPEARFLIRGKNDIFDPRDDSTGWTDNAALCVRDYITWSNGLADPDVDDTTWSTAATRCAEQVTTQSGTEARFTCNGALELDIEPRAALEQLLSAMAGRAVFSAGVWRGYAAGYDTPVKAFTADNLRGDVVIDPRPARQSLFNRVRGTFVDERDDLWVATDFPAVENATYETEDGEQITADIQLPFTIGHWRAQRIAKIELERARQSIVVTLPVNTTGHELQPWDVITLTLESFGWDTKAFRVTDWGLDPDGGTRLMLREEASASYDWNEGEATAFDPAPNTSLPTPFDVPEPEAITVTEALYSGRDGGGVKVQMTVTWTPPANVYARRYELQHKRPGETEYDGGRTLTAATWTAYDLTPGLHDVRVRCLNGLGFASDWVTKTYQVIGLEAPPADITGLTITAVGGMAVLRWTLHPDLDVREGGNIAIRHSAAQSGATWETSRVVGQALPGNSMIGILPLLAGSYLVKAKDQHGYSLNAASVSTKAAQLGTHTTAGTVIEGPVFAGTHNGTVNTDGVLKLDGGTNFDDLPGTVDDLDDWDSAGGVVASGTYDFAAGLDLMLVRTVRLTTHLEALIFQPLDLFDDRGGNVDDWGLFDGDINGNEASIEVWVRETDDDPAGSPTWSDWQMLDVGDYEARAFEFQARLTSTDQAYNVQTAQITITATEAT